jgi:hypothetical protein
MSSTGAPLRLGLEVRFDAAPIEGRLFDGRGLDTRFSGWLGLMAAIEKARGRHDEADKVDRPGGGGGADGGGTAGDGPHAGR